MKQSVIRRDFSKNKLIHIILILFIALSTAIATLSVSMGVRTLSSISGLYSIANPPHFLQMHKGDIDMDELESFMQSQDYVTSWQVQSSIQIDGYAFTHIRGQENTSLSDFRIDIGLVRQNPEKDLLLEQDMNVITLQAGQIGIPILLSQMYDIRIGDQIEFNANGIQKVFTVDSIVLDSMMNSTMCSSTRVLISDEDYELLYGNVGEVEHLIEAYFDDTSKASIFQSEYENAGMPQNGQAIQYAFMFAISALTDLVTVFVLLFAAFFILMIAFVCVRFVLLATLEEEVKTIGSLKAIGIAHGDIRNIYLMKYRFCAILGILAGVLLSLPLQPLLSANIREHFGSVGSSALVYALPVPVGILVYFLIISYCRGILRKIKKQSVVDSLLRNKSFEKTSGAIKSPLRRFRPLSINVTMAVRESIFHFRKWAIVFFVVAAAVIFTQIPVNLLSTFRSPDFITYMGHAKEDVMIIFPGNVGYFDNAPEEVRTCLTNDPDVRTFNVARKIRLRTARPDGSMMNMEVDFGTNSGQGLQYLEGRAPTGQVEIALSFLNAEESQKNVGDIITYYNGDERIDFIVSGIYQDVTAAGRTAKSQRDIQSDEVVKYVFSVLLNDSSLAEKKAAQWTESLSDGIRVDPMDALIDQTLGGVSDQLEKAVIIISIIGPALCLLIGLLYLRLRIVKDRFEIAGLKTIGFSVVDLRSQYRTKIFTTALLGLIAGTAVSYGFGHFLINAVLGMSGLGIKNVMLVHEPIFGLILYPMIILLLLSASADILCRAMIRREIAPQF